MGNRGGKVHTKTVKIDKLPTIRRLPAYLHILRSMEREGREYVSSSHLAQVKNIEPILVRKDLELTGIAGTRKIGYSIPDLIRAIESFLGWGDTLDTFLIGVGQLGTALLAYKELEKHGHQIVAAFDRDPAKIGKKVHGVPVFDVAKAPELLGRMDVRLAILTVPDEAAQQVTDLLVQAGIRGIWNFTSVILEVPEGVITQKEELLSGLAVLSMKMAGGRDAGEHLGGLS